MEPFLDAEAFADMYGQALTDAQELQVAPLLEVIASWIRVRKPDIAADDPAAIVVSFEVVRDALAYGKYAPLSSFDEETSHSKSSGTLRMQDIERFITSRHQVMLGLLVSTGAKGHFPVCDY